MKEKVLRLINFRKNNKIHNLYDVELLNTKELREYSSIECHVVLYPYSRKITKDDYSFNPFEEYVDDIAMNQKSAYHKIKSRNKEFFGIFLGLIVLAAFIASRPSTFITVEAILGIFGAYFIGKDLWNDLEDFFINISKDWRLRFQDNYYSYELDKNSTLTQYSHFAKKQRYGKYAILPEQMEFIEQHNSSTARMCFTQENLSHVDGAVHLFSINMAEGLLQDFEKEGYMLGVKVSLNKKFLCFERGIDYFQSLSNGKRGCLDKSGNWLDGTVHFRRVVKLGRLKFYVEKGYLKDKEMIN